MFATPSMIESHRAPGYQDPISRFPSILLVLAVVLAPALLAAPATGHCALQSSVSSGDAGHIGDPHELAIHPLVIDGTTAEVGTVSRRTDARLWRSARAGTRAPRLLQRAAKRLRQSDVSLASASAQRVSASCRLAPDGVLARAMGDVGCVLSTP
jgi:hypothetical protein